jgi:hypothetical protein
MRAWRLPALSLLLAFSAACTSQDPPTITAPPPAQPGTQPLSSGQTIEITVPPPQPQSLPPIKIGASAMHVDAGGLFAIELPLGWVENRQDTVTDDVKLGTVFSSAENNGVLSITQFDNGKRPASLGVTTNQVLKMTGWTDLPGFEELARENVIERDGDALRIDVVYSRSNGVPMRSLVLFQIDGTTFSMVNLGVTRESWTANEGKIRDLLATYRAPAPAGSFPTADPSAAPDSDASSESDQG